MEFGSFGLETTHSTPHSLHNQNTLYSKGITQPSRLTHIWDWVGLHEVVFWSFSSRALGHIWRMVGIDGPRLVP